MLPIIEKYILKALKWMAKFYVRLNWKNLYPIQGKPTKVKQVPNKDKTDVFFEVLAFALPLFPDFVLKNAE